MRKWTFDDIKEIAKLESEIFVEPWTEEELKSSFNGGNFYTQLIEFDGQIVAYVGANVTNWDSDICLIAVKKEYRRQGLAIKLLNKLIEFAKANNQEKIFLEVRASNESAINLYKKMGFTPYGIRKNYYGTEDAINMVLIL